MTISTNTVVVAVAALAALALVGLLLMILLPNKALSPAASHNVGDFTSGGLAGELIMTSV